MWCYAMPTRRSPGYRWVLHHVVNQPSFGRLQRLVYCSRHFRCSKYNIYASWQPRVSPAASRFSLPRTGAGRDDILSSACSVECAPPRVQSR